jgi:hypothetical protein
MAKTKKGGSSEKRHPAIEAIGWVSAVLIIVAYGLLTFNVLSPHSALYLIMNIVGSLGLVAIAEVKKLFQSVILNIIWAAVALVALVQLWQS